MASVIVSAKEASTAATTPALLQALDDTELRRGLAEVCPEEVARLSAPQLLRRWESHVAVAEMAHNFYARDPDDWPDRSSHPNNDPPLSVYAATGANWFFNLWTPCVLNMAAKRATTGWCETLSTRQRWELSASGSSPEGQLPAQAAARCHSHGPTRWQRP